jgi:hypothetical protein
MSKFKSVLTRGLKLGLVMLGVVAVSISSVAVFGPIPLEKMGFDPTEANMIRFSALVVLAIAARLGFHGRVQEEPENPADLERGSD